MTDYPTYSEYKVSGVTWIEKIPKHWENWKISHAFDIIGSGTTPLTHRREYYNGQIPWVNTSELRDSLICSTAKKLTSQALRDHSTLHIYPKGTLLVALYGATIGKVGILEIPATTNQACCALAGSEYLSPKFTFYWLIAHREPLINLSYGGGQPNISQEIIRSLRVPAPPLLAQRAIAAFLDRETDRLDALTHACERLLDVLEERRAALISHAVTQGLAPDVAMKDSGVPWLGEIPAHWKTRRLKYAAPESGEKLSEKPDNMRYVGLENIESGTGRLLLSDLTDDVESAVVAFQKKDILFGKLRPYLAKVVHADFNGVGTTELLVLRPRTDVDSKFLFYSLLNDDFIKTVNGLTYGTKMPRANSDQVGGLRIVVPPLPEQRAIAAHLDRETAKLDALAAKIRAAIERLAEYRTALISAAVTGKIDVRAWQDKTRNAKAQGRQDAKS